MDFSFFSPLSLHLRFGPYSTPRGVKICWQTLDLFSYNPSLLKFVEREGGKEKSLLGTLAHEQID